MTGWHMQGTNSCSQRETSSDSQRQPERTPVFLTGYLHVQEPLGCKDSQIWEPMNSQEKPDDRLCGNKRPPFQKDEL